MLGVRMKNDINLENILEIYEKEISKNVKNKKQVYHFEINKIQNINNIIIMLNNGIVGHTKYNIFLVYEPKCRLVMSLSVKDKIINHFVTRYCLEKKLTKYLDDRKCATRKNMGTDYALQLTKKFIEKNKKYGDFYVLKLDIAKYFYSIDHEVLKSLLIDKLDQYEFNVISNIIDSINHDYIVYEVDRIMKEKNMVLPRPEMGKGLPIGNITSQFLSIYYLYKIDHFIVHTLRLSSYVRYMDDFIIMSPSLEKLKDAELKLKEKLENEYKLKVHNKKTMIVNIKHGFSFLGYTFKVQNKKTIITLKRSNYERIKKKIKKVRYDYKQNNISLYGAFCSIMTYYYGYKYCNQTRLRNLIERYFYNEK